MTDTENTNHADYSHDLDMCVRLVEALIMIQEVMENNPVRTPVAMVAYNTILYGLIPRINTKCEHDDKCQVSTNTPVGGFLDALEALDEAITVLRMEVDYEGGEELGEEEEEEG